MNNFTSSNEECLSMLSAKSETMNENIEILLVHIINVNINYENNYVLFS